MVERLFLVVPRGCLQFVIVVFPDHTHLLFVFKNLHSGWCDFVHKIECLLLWFVSDMLSEIKFPQVPSLLRYSRNKCNTV